MEHNSGLQQGMKTESRMQVHLSSQEWWLTGGQRTLHSKAKHNCLLKVHGSCGLSRSAISYLTLMLTWDFSECKGLAKPSCLFFFLSENVIETELEEQAEQPAFMGLCSSYFTQSVKLCPNNSTSLPPTLRASRSMDGINYDSNISGENVPVLRRLLICTNCLIYDSLKNTIGNYWAREIAQSAKASRETQGRATEST